MGILSFVGIIISFVAIVAGIVVVGGDLTDFLDLASALVVIIPTIGSLVATYPIALLAKVPSHLKVIMSKGYQLEDYIGKIVELARKARTEGLLALENEQMDGPYMTYALRMVVDGVDEETIRNSLSDSLAAVKSRHEETISLYEKAGAYAPSYGMAGTVVGLINMLMSMDFSDPNAINSLGGNMALALITTLYGSVLASVVFQPIAARLRVLHKREMFCKTMLGNSFLAIQRGENPSIIQDSLVEQLSEKSKRAFVAAGGGGVRAGG